MITQSELQNFLQEMNDDDFMCGVLDHLLSRIFTCFETYAWEGHVSSRMAIVMYNLGYIYPLGDDDFVLILGRPPLVEHSEIINLQTLGDRLLDSYGYQLDEWAELDDELPEEEFSLFTWSKVAQAAASGKRDEIYPVLNHFMKIFRYLSNYFLEYMEVTMCVNFEGGEITDKTLENAFISFVEFVNQSVLPKLKPNPQLA